MIWYHYTGFRNLERIFEDGALMSIHERDRRKHPNDPRVDQMIQRYKAEKGKRGFQRCEYVYLTNQNAQPMGSNKNQVVLGFDLPNKPNFGENLIISYVSLDHMFEIGTSLINKAVPRSILEKYTDYSHVEVVGNTSCRP